MIESARSFAISHAHAWRGEMGNDQTEYNSLSAAFLSKQYCTEYMATKYTHIHTMEKIRRETVSS